MENVNNTRCNLKIIICLYTLALKFLSVFISCGKIMEWSVLHMRTVGVLQLDSNPYLYRSSYTFCRNETEYYKTNRQKFICYELTSEKQKHINIFLYVPVTLIIRNHFTIISFNLLRGQSNVLDYSSIQTMTILDWQVNWPRVNGPLQSIFHLVVSTNRGKSVAW